MAISLYTLSYTRDVFFQLWNLCFIKFVLPPWVYCPKRLSCFKNSNLKLARPASRPASLSYMYMYIYYICGKMQLFRYKFFVFWHHVYKMHNFGFLRGRDPMCWISPWEKCTALDFSLGEIQCVGFLPGRHAQLRISPREKSNVLDFSLGEMHTQ